MDVHGLINLYNRTKSEGHDPNVGLGIIIGLSAIAESIDKYTEYQNGIYLTLKK